jgi:predicted outer membrane repeat protein
MVKRIIIAVVSFILINVFMISAFAQANVVYVNQANKEGSHDGQSWATAYTDLQEAIDQAQKQKKEVWVAKGVYYPTTTDDKSISFQMKEGVSVYGGFIGNETTRQGRNWTKNLTILNGGRKNSAMHSYHVVVAANDAVLDGFVITGGRALGAKSLAVNGKEEKGHLSAGGQHANFKNLVLGAKDQMGGGLLIQGTNPTIRHCMFVGNIAQKGGAVYQVATASNNSVTPSKNAQTPKVDPRKMTSSQLAAPIKQSIEKGKSPTFDHVIFIDNTAFSRGGAINSDILVTLIIKNSIFYENMTSGKGGAIYNDVNATTRVTNTLFVKNKANLGGGAIGIDGSSKVLIVNSTFTQNISGDTGAGLYLGSHGINRPGNLAVVFNSIFWGNQLQTNGPADIYAWAGNVVHTQYSNIQQGYIGLKNINKDPLFVSTKALNFNLSKESPCLKGADSTIARQYVGDQTSQLGYLNDANLSQWIQIASTIQQR